MSETRIINTYDQCAAAGGERVVISYRNQERGRGSRSAAWQVWLVVNGKSVSTDKDTPWYNYGKKTFDLWGRHERAAKLATAIAWATEKYGARDFVLNRMGDYVEREVNEKFPLPKREYKRKVSV